MIRLLKTCLSCIWNLVTFKRLGEVEAMRGLTSPRAKKLTAVYMASLIVGGAAFLQLQTRGCLPQIIRTVWGARTTLWWRTGHVVHIPLESDSNEKTRPAWSWQLKVLETTRKKKDKRKHSEFIRTT
jgi:hypothetical protein